jgi:chlorophyll synthase
MAAAVPDWRIFLVAGLYSAGAHGIMTLNDFKSVDGDRRMGIGSLPARLGVDAAARVACVMMAMPQVAVVGALVGWGRPFAATVVGLLLLVQLLLMTRLLRQPREQAAWYSGTGVSLYVTGMLISAFALGSIITAQ